MVDGGDDGILIDSSETARVRFDEVVADGADSLELAVADGATAIGLSSASMSVSASCVIGADEGMSIIDGVADSVFDR